MHELAFVIVFHPKRLDNLHQTLFFLIRNHGDIVPRSHLVLVCQNESEEFYEGASFGKYTHINTNVDQMMLPRFTNTGVDAAEAEKIVVLESDRILPPGYFQAVADQLKPGLQITTKTTLKLTEPVTHKQIIDNQFKYTEDGRSPENKIGMRNMWSGNTAFMKSDFLKCGGMDTEYIGYGWADNDMTYTMESNGVESIFRDEIELHLWHPPFTYGKGDHSQMFIANGLRFCKKWNIPVPMWLNVRNSKKLWM